MTDVSGTIVLGVVAPTLTELKERKCSPEELQSALVQLIEAYNEQGRIMAREIRNKQDKEWRATL